MWPTLIRGNIVAVGGFRSLSETMLGSKVWRKAHKGKLQKEWRKVGSNVESNAFNSWLLLRSLSWLSNSIVWCHQMTLVLLKVDAPKSKTTTIIGTRVFERYVVTCGSKNWHHKDMCLKKIGLHAQSMSTILGSINNWHDWGEGLYDLLVNTRIFTFIMNKIP